MTCATTFEMGTEWVGGIVGLDAILFPEGCRSFEHEVPGCELCRFGRLRTEGAEPGGAFCESRFGKLGDSGADEGFAVLEVFGPFGVHDASGNRA